jgi:hypothetical protein
VLNDRKSPAHSPLTTTSVESSFFALSPDLCHDHKPFFEVSCTPEIESEPSPIEIAHEREKLQFVTELWLSLISRLHTAGKQVDSQQLFNVYVLREPPKAVVDMLGYIALLLGLKPTWKTIRGTLLKESDILCNFLQEVCYNFCLFNLHANIDFLVNKVNPLEIQPRRLKKAIAWKNENLEGFSPMMLESTCRSTVTIAKYVVIPQLFS